MDLMNSARAYTGREHFAEGMFLTGEYSVEQ